MTRLTTHQIYLLVLIFFSYISFYTFCNSVENVLYSYFGLSSNWSRAAYVLGFMGRYLLPNFIAANLADSYFGQSIVLYFSVCLACLGCILGMVGALESVDSLFNLGYGLAMCGFGASMPLALCLFLNQNGIKSMDQHGSLIGQIHVFYFMIALANVVSSAIYLPLLSDGLGTFFKFPASNTDLALATTYVSFAASLFGVAAVTLIKINDAKAKKNQELKNILIEKMPVYERKIDILGRIVLTILSSFYRYCCCCVCFCSSRKIVDPQKKDIEVIKIGTIEQGQDNEALEMEKNHEKEKEGQKNSQIFEAELDLPISACFTSVGHLFPKQILKDASDFSSLFWLFWAVAFYYAGYIDSVKRWHSMLAMTDVYLNEEYSSFIPPSYVRFYIAIFIAIFTLPLGYLSVVLPAKPSRKIMAGLFLGASSLYVSSYMQVYLDDHNKTRLNTVSIHMTLGVYNQRNQNICGWFSQDDQGLVSLERFYGGRTLPGNFTDPFLLISKQSTDFDDLEIHRNSTFFNYYLNDEGVSYCNPYDEEFGELFHLDMTQGENWEKDTYSNYRLVVNEDQSCQYRAIGSRTLTGYVQVKFISTGEEIKGLRDDTSRYSIQSSNDQYVPPKSKGDPDHPILSPVSCNSKNNFTLKESDSFSDRGYENLNTFLVKPGLVKVNLTDNKLGISQIIEFEAGYGSAFDVFIGTSIDHSIYRQTINTNTVSVWYLLPQIILLALSDIIVVTSSFEYAYKFTRLSIQTISINVVIAMLGCGNVIRLFVSLEPEIFGHFYVSDFAWYVTWGGCMCISVVKFIVFSWRSDL